jgi:hypothetical protein
MKYVVIVAIVILFVRIDFWLGLFDQANENFSSETEEVSSTETSPARETISMKDDSSFKTAPKTIFLSLLDFFRSSPSSETRQRALTILKENPTMFNQKLDKELESQIFRWRELLNNNNPEAVNFLLDLIGSLQGENQQMIYKFFSLWMEIDMEKFIAAYSRTKDTNCMIATVFGDNIPEEEKLNLYYDRETDLKLLLNKEKIDPAHRALANSCLLVLGVKISKMTSEAPEVTP